ncbi:hypothetical protein SKAU_G00256340 [Synaphobranchus kaupii]|uniref:Uncharacterized protein n=1 Tax=Synaphobranchus kaupii TaxID=118154 RepID=A0A9Q1F3V4_SYNKA|nr:hypothetical protein SKAU_G00256340 [Synaphobranchus kaupii]
MKRGRPGGVARARDGRTTRKRTPSRATALRPWPAGEQPLAGAALTPPRPRPRGNAHQWVSFLSHHWRKREKRPDFKRGLAWRGNQLKPCLLNLETPPPFSHHCLEKNSPSQIWSSNLDLAASQTRNLFRKKPSRGSWVSNLLAKKDAATLGPGRISGFGGAPFFPADFVPCRSHWLDRRNAWRCCRTHREAMIKVLDKRLWTDHGSLAKGAPMLTRL